MLPKDGVELFVVDCIVAWFFCAILFDANEDVEFDKIVELDEDVDDPDDNLFSKLFSLWSIKYYFFN